ncbi:uncharacterized protein LOC144134204 [Amblyomma americanum]
MSNNNCCVVGCSNTYKNTPETRCYSFPARPYERERRQQWIAAVRRQRKDGSLWEPTKHSRICSNHFVNGEKSNDPRSPAYLPTLFPSEYRRTKTPSAYRYERLRSREQSKEPTSSCVQEVATDEEGYDSTNGLISATFPSKKETKNAAWGTSYGVKDSACDPMNIDSLKSTCSFRGYSSVSACSSEKASDILKSIAGVSLPWLAHCFCSEALEEYTGKDLDVALSDGTAWDQYKWISVYFFDSRQNLGHFGIPSPLKVPVNVGGSGGSRPQRALQRRLRLGNQNLQAGSGTKTTKLVLCALSERLILFLNP